ncbi:MAG: hypothetical protein ACTSPE_05700 [Candidatus Thorarchaeota archaeon]
MPEGKRVTIVPTSSMSFEKQVLVLRAYVVLSNMGRDSVHYKKVVRITKMARTQVSGVNAFFVTQGFLKPSGRGLYLPTQETVEFYSSQPGRETYSALTSILRESPLFNLVRGAVLIHGHATVDEIIDLLLTESGEKTRSRAKRALQWLERCGLIEIDAEKQVRLLMN